MQIRIFIAFLCIFALAHGYIALRHVFRRARELRRALAYMVAGARLTDAGEMGVTA